MLVVLQLAGAAYLCLPFHWNKYYYFLFGSILCATDPVSVMSKRVDHRDDDSDDDGDSDDDDDGVDNPVMVMIMLMHDRHVEVQWCQQLSFNRNSRYMFYLPSIFSIKTTP